MGNKVPRRKPAVFFLKLTDCATDNVLILDGRDPSALSEVIQLLEPPMKQGKYRDAGALFDGALKVLNESEKATTGKPITAL